LTRGVAANPNGADQLHHQSDGCCAGLDVPDEHRQEKLERSCRFREASSVCIPSGRTGRPPIARLVPAGDS